MSATPRRVNKRTPGPSRSAAAAARSSGAAPLAGLPAIAAVAATFACGGEETQFVPPPPADVGTVEVIWDFETQDGVDTTCDKVGVAEVIALVGGLRSDAARGADVGNPPGVACGEGNSELWSNMPVGNYPVALVALNASGETITDFTGVVIVTSQMRATVQHTFGISGTGRSTGDLQLNWVIDNRSGLEACLGAGADRVTFRTVSGSIEDFEASASCAQGGLLLEDLRIGTYVLRAELRAADGTVLSVDQRDPRVEANEQISQTYAFNIELLEPARIHTEWTIGGEDPAAICADAGFTDVEVELQQPNPDGGFVTVLTATATCDAAELDIVTAATPGLPRLEMFLLDEFIGDRFVVSSTVVPDLRLRPAETTSVSADFPLP